MPRSTLARRVVALPLLALGCASPQGARLYEHGVGLGGAPLGEPRTVEASGNAGAAVVADHVLEATMRRELEERRRAGGAAAIEVLEPGTTIESRLRFAFSRLLLDRRKDAAAALDALTADVPGCALAWFLLGQIRAEEGDAVVAAGLMRRARALQREQGVAQHPALNFALGRTLLATDEYEEGLRLLREELPAGAHRVRAAEVLAQVQAELGDFEAALAAVDAVLDDVPDEPALVVAKAELLADQLRHDEALLLLERSGQRVPLLAREVGRAGVLRQRGDAEAASTALAALIDEHGEQGAVKAALPRLQALRAELENERTAGERTRMRPRELLGRLRYAPQPSERAAAVRVLCGEGAPATVVPAAVRWALRDPHPTVRAAAIQAGLPRCGNAADLLVTGLGDEAAEVRAAAASAAARRPARAMFAPLVAAIGRESDPAAFRAMHRALVVVSGRDLDLPFDGERAADIRGQLAQAWRAELERSGRESSGS